MMRSRPRRPKAFLGALLRALLGALGVLLAASSGASAQGNFAQPTKSLEVASWWTSASENAALNVLFDRFKQAHPDVTIDNAAVKGGAGSNVQIVLATRLLEGNPPDVWQTFLGTSLRTYAQRGQIVDVSSVFEQTKLTGTIPAAVLQAATWSGKQWGVPTGAHRGNMLWFKPALLKQAGVAVPSSGYAAAAFAADLATLKTHGVTPLCLGAKDRFTTTELFENVLLSIVGISGWSDIAADRFNWNGPEVQKAFEQLGHILDYADVAAASLTWDEAAKRLASGKCAFLSMNDSLYGELVANGVAPSDIGYTAFPGTDGAFLAILDTFVVARNAKDGYNALQFLSTIGSAATELAFAKLKGSAPLRKDVDISSLPAYQQSAYKAMNTGAILLSITHGELLGPQFQEAMYDGVAAFAQSRSANAFTDKIQQAMVGVVPTGH
jgi:glucose/mannose transport system substrate-binding protein